MKFSLFFRFRVDPDIGRVGGDMLLFLRCHGELDIG